MADITIIKLKVRRGTNTQRKSVILDQGELGYTTDTKRLFVGNGVLSGGVVVGSKVHPILSNYSSLTGTIAEINDVVVAASQFYQLTASDYTNINSWANISNKYDPTIFNLDGNGAITLTNNSIAASKLLSSSVNSGLAIQSGSLTLQYDATNFTLASNKLTLNSNGVDKSVLNSTAFGNGLTGGSGAIVGMNLDSNYLYVNGSNKLSISAFPFTALNSNWFGTGLSYDGVNSKINANVADVDNTTIIKNPSTKIISLPATFTNTSNEMSMVTTDQYGRTTLNQNAIFDVLTGKSASNNTNSLSSIFNGTPAHTINGAIPGLPVTQFQAMSSYNGNTLFLTLTSAGFIVFNGNTTTRADGKAIGRYAIPIFAY